MHVDALSLVDFRNYEKLDFWPSVGLNVLVGVNAQGKSGILEAIYLLATSKSHRTSHDADMIRIGAAMARVFADVKRSARNDISVEVILNRIENKTVKLNTVRHPKVGDIVGQLNAVIFSSSDLDMVKGEPSRRRRFLNLEISQVSPQYVYSLGRYKRVLDQRNNLLREIKVGAARANGLPVWDEQLAQYGAAVIARRRDFVGFLSEAARRIYSLLTDESESFGVDYKANLETDRAESEQDIAKRFSGTLASRTDMDIGRGVTGVGPHRDDVALTINGMAAREFASQGQQRTAALALKLAEIELMGQSSGESPVVLLDDVMGELDENRRARVLELTTGRCQTFVTTTRLDELGSAALGEASVFEVHAGRVTPK